MKEKLFQSEKIIKAYKSDIEYLKNEIKSQEDVTTRLNEILEKSREEKDESIKTISIKIFSEEEFNNEYEIIE